MRISASRPTNGGSRASLRFAPPRMATTRSARQALTGSSLPLRTFSPAGSKVIATDAARIVASSTSSEPGGAADCSREAVLTMSPATMPWPVAPIVTAASPVVTPARSWRSAESTCVPSSRTARISSSPARTARSASSSCAVGVPKAAMTASPMNFSTTPP